MSHQNKTVTEQVQEVAQNTWDATKNTAANATESVQNMFSAGQEKAADTADKAGRAVKPESEKTVGDKAQDTWDATKDAAANVTESVQNMFSAGQEKAKETADKAGRAVKPESEKTMGDKAKDTWDATKNSAQNASDAVQSKVQETQKAAQSKTS
ncbi:hypothetical protein DIPPA_05112 [Diplonema papillatum]|nr:hypothetical protein DIPPA_05112 [Diplonema papillatum]